MGSILIQALAAEPSPACDINAATMVRTPYCVQYCSAQDSLPLVNANGVQKTLPCQNTNAISTKTSSGVERFIVKR